MHTRQKIAAVARCARLNSSVHPPAVRASIEQRRRGRNKADGSSCAQTTRFVTAGPVGFRSAGEDRDGQPGCLLGLRR